MRRRPASDSAAFITVCLMSTHCSAARGQLLLPSSQLVQTHVCGGNVHVTSSPVDNTDGFLRNIFRHVLRCKTKIIIRPEFLNIFLRTVISYEFILFFLLNRVGFVPRCFPAAAAAGAVMHGKAAGGTRPACTGDHSTLHVKNTLESGEASPPVLHILKPQAG